MVGQNNSQVSKTVATQREITILCGADWIELVGDAWIVCYLRLRDVSKNIGFHSFILRRINAKLRT
jgi:hypothetical protein